MFTGKIAGVTAGAASGRLNPAFAGLDIGQRARPEWVAQARAWAPLTLGFMHR